MIAASPYQVSVCEAASRVLVAHIRNDQPIAIESAQKTAIDPVSGWARLSPAVAVIGSILLSFAANLPNLLS